MVSDEVLRERLRALLPTVDLQLGTERSLREQLSEEFGGDLKSQKAVFREEIERYLQTREDDVESDDEQEDEKAAPKRKRGIGGMCTASPPLLAFLGLEEGTKVTRNEVVKQLWTYIKANDLQNPDDKRKIVLDARLSTVFKHPMNMLTMNKQLSKHIKSDKDLADSPAPAKKQKKAKAKGTDEAPKKPAAKKPATKKAGSKAKQENGEEKVKAPVKQAVYNLSTELQALVKQDTATRGQLLKLMWAYVKEHNLQNPENMKQIQISRDPNLRALLGQDACEGLGMMKYLKSHILEPVGK